MKKQVNNLILVLIMRNAKASGTNTDQRMIMDFVNHALKMNNIKIKAQKKEIISILILNAKDANRSLS